jgi:hypothetical protein
MPVLISLAVVYYDLLFAGKYPSLYCLLIAMGIWKFEYGLMRAILKNGIPFLCSWLQLFSGKIRP